MGLGIASFAYLWARSGGRPVSLDEARRRFLEENFGEAAGTLRFTPAEGVYSYEGTGSESLSTPPKSQDEGPEMPATVTQRADGCWTFRLDYSSNHWRKWIFCRRGDQLVQTGNRVFQRWDLVVSTIDNLSVMSCHPPGVVVAAGMEPGDEWESTCRGTNTRVSGETVSLGTHRYVGPEAVDVGGSTIDTFHFHDERVVTGAQTGTEEFDFWLSAEGLPVQGHQRIVVESDSPLGRITYTQEGAFHLVKLVPKS